MKNTKEMIFDFLQRGRKNAIPARELADMLGCDIRVVWALIHELRAKDGVLICSCQRGVFLPAERAEVIDFCATMAKRRNQLWEAAAPAEAFLKEGTSYE